MNLIHLHGVIIGPVHICSRYTTPAKCSRNKFSVHKHSDCEHCEMFSVPLRSDLKSAHISVCAVWLIVYTLRNVWGHINPFSVQSLWRFQNLAWNGLTCTLRGDSGLRATSPAQLEHVLGFTSFRLRFGGVLRGWFVPRTWFDCVPAGTVLAGTRLFRTRSDYKKWCVPRTCSRWNCTENKCERPDSCL